MAMRHMSELLLKYVSAATQLCCAMQQEWVTNSCWTSNMVSRSDAVATSARSMEHGLPSPASMPVRVRGDVMRYALDRVSSTRANAQDSAVSLRSSGPFHKLATSAAAPSGARLRGGLAIRGVAV